jgi:hypothetical protein
MKTRIRAVILLLPGKISYLFLQASKNKSSIESSGTLHQNWRLKPRFQAIYEFHSKMKRVMHIIISIELIDQGRELINIVLN